MLRNTGPGQVSAEQDHGFIKALLYNFDIEGDQLKREHEVWLDQHAVPALRTVGFVFVRGMASRTGKEAFNLALSKRRAGQVYKYLSPRARQPLPIEVRAIGEILSGEGPRENELHRAVQVFIWPKDEPPLPPGIPAKMVQRITQRHWSGAETKTMNLHDGMPNSDGELGTVFLSIFDDTVGEQRFLRTTLFVPENWAVISVKVEREERDPTARTDSFLVKTSGWSETKTYVWGLPTPFITLTKSTVYYDREGQVRQTMVEKPRQVPREQAKSQKLVPPTLKAKQYGLQ